MQVWVWVILNYCISLSRVIECSMAIIPRIGHQLSQNNRKTWNFMNRTPKNPSSKSFAQRTQSGTLIQQGACAWRIFYSCWTTLKKFVCVPVFVMKYWIAIATHYVNMGECRQLFPASGICVYAGEKEKRVFWCKRYCQDCI